MEAKRAPFPPVDGKALESIIEDFFISGSTAGKGELSAVAAALYVEECLGLVLADDEMTEANLGSPEAMKAFLARKAGS
jgi:hypothetical protein